MTDILQPEALDTETLFPDLPDDAFPLDELNGLPQPVQAELLDAHGFTIQQKLEIVRAWNAYAETTDFDEALAKRRQQLKIDREAKRLEREELQEHLSSDEGLAAAAAAFAVNIGIDDLEEPDPLIEGVITKDTLVRTFGPPKSLKSFVTLDMAACVSLGRPWMGRPTEKAKVLYIVAEGGRGILKRRDAWNEHHDAEMEVIFHNGAVQAGDEQQMFGLIAYCLLNEVGYVIFDTQARCTVGVNENDNTEMGVIVAALDVLKQRTGACVHLIHHSVGSDDTKARGATAFDGAVDAEFVVRRDKNDREAVELITKFQKDEEEAAPVRMRTVAVGKSLALVGDGVGEARAAGTGEVAPALVSDANAFYLDAVRRFGNQDVTVTDVVEDFRDRGVQRSRTAIKKAFGALQGNGALEPVGKGTAVRLTQAGLVFSDTWRQKQAEGGIWDGQETLEDPDEEG